MSNAAFTPGIEGLMSGEIDLDTAVLKAALVRGYTFSAAHKFVSDITNNSGTLNGTSAALSSVAVTGGVLDAADTTITTTASANDHSLVIFQSSAVTGGSDVASSSQRLLCWLDTGTGLPIQPGTGSVAVTWSNGSAKILKIG